MITNIDQIKDQANIVTVIEQYVQLKRKGNSHLACCPFHDEKTPSFSVSEVRNAYKCFGCGVSGDSISFIMEHLGLAFPESVEHVAKVCSLNIEYSNDVDRVQFLKDNAKQEAKKKELSKSLTEAYEIYIVNSQLDKKEKDGKIEVFNNRSYSASTIEAFRLAIAPDTNILSDLKDETILSHLREAGWVIASSYSTENAQTWYDFFKGRLLFPITNIKGQVIGISARDLTGKSDDKKSGVPKYINSPESDIYHKGQLLYGLKQALSSIRQEGYVNLVEGNTDVVAFHDHEIRNTVAPLGTAFTTEQAKLIARFTDVVNIAFDADALKKDVIQQAIDLLIKENVHVDVTELPEDHDPDSLVRDGGKDAWIEVKEKNTYDGIEWCIIQKPLKNPADRESALKYAVNLICEIDSEVQRNMYCKSISTILKMKQADITRDVNDRLDSKYSKKNSLKPYQQADADEYGVYIDHDRFYKAFDGKPGVSIANFSMKPLMLIKGAEESQRLVEIKNYKGQKEITSIESNDFVALGTMKKKVEGKGNYIFTGTETEYTRVKSMIYDKCPTCYPIVTMGLHKRGFFTWGNGITTPEGNFIPVNNYGVVKFGDFQYYLETFSDIKNHIESDDGDTNEDPGEYYVYKNADKCPEFTEWSSTFIKVFGDNGMIAICWYIASVYRDIFMKKLKFFPHLNLFGPPGSGKSFMGWRLAAMCGEQRDPAPLPTTSTVGMARLVAQVRNLFIWFEEYTSDLKHEQNEMLKNIPDGFSRKTGTNKNSRSTVQTPIRCGAILSGQVLPNGDPALLNRCITLFFKVTPTSSEQQEYAEILKSWEDGRLSKITSHLHSLRPIVEKELSESISDTRETLKSLIDVEVDDRMANAYTTVVSIYSVLAKHLGFSFRLNALTDFVVTRMYAQREVLKGSEEVSGFWSIMKHLLGRGLIDRELIIIQKTAKITKISKGNSTVKEIFEEPKIIVYMVYDVLFGYYRENGKKQGLERLFDQNVLEYYLTNNSGFAGICKAKSFDGKSKRCMMFYADELPIHFDENYFPNATGFQEPAAHSPPKQENHQAGMKFPDEGDSPFN